MYKGEAFCNVARPLKAGGERWRRVPLGEKMSEQIASAVLFKQKTSVVPPIVTDNARMFSEPEMGLVLGFVEKICGAVYFAGQAFRGMKN